MFCNNFKFEELGMVQAYNSNFAGSLTGLYYYRDERCLVKIRSPSTNVDQSRAQELSGKFKKRESGDDDVF